MKRHTSDESGAWNDGWAGVAKKLGEHGICLVLTLATLLILVLHMNGVIGTIGDGPRAAAATVVP